VEETLGEKEFKDLVRPFLSINSGVHIAVVPLGLSSWEIRAGYTYWVAETRQMTISIFHTDHKKTTLKTPGNSTLDGVCEAYRTRWHLPIWDYITITRADNAPFWVEEKGEYAATVQYDPDRDTRIVCRIRVETSKEGKIYIIDDYRCDSEDPVAIWANLCEKYGFVKTLGINHLEVTGHPRDGEVRFRFKIPTALDKVKIASSLSRWFRIHVQESEWDTGEILSLSAWDKKRIWQQLSEIRDLPHISQFLIKTKEGREIRSD
jgi:hypothetical protein